MRQIVEVRTAFEPLHQRMLGIDFQDGQRFRRTLSRLFQQPCQMPAHVPIVHHQASRRIHQPRRHTHILGAILQRFLQPLEQRLQGTGDLLCLLLLGLVLQLAEVDRTLRDALQRLAVEFVKVTQQPFVDAIDQQQHLDPLLAEDLELRAALGSCQRVGGDDVDRVLAFFHAR